MSMPIEARTIRARGALEIRADGLYLRGYTVEDVRLTAHPSLVALRIREENAETPQYVQASDVLFVLTGLESVPSEQVDHWRSAFLYARNQLSEIVEIYRRDATMDVSGHQVPIPHPVTLTLFWIPDAEPFFEEVKEAQRFLDHLAHFPVDLSHSPQLFAACLIALGKLRSLLESFDEAQLTSIAERVIDGKSFLEVIRRAQSAVAQMNAHVMGNEEDRQVKVRTTSIPVSIWESQRTIRNISFTCVLITLLGLLVCWGLHKKRVHVSLEFKWYDFWRGLYIRPHKPGEESRHVYWCPVRCFVIHFEWPFTAS